MIAVTKVLFERPAGYNPRVDGAFAVQSKSPFADKRRDFQNQKEDLMKKFRDRMKARRMQGV